MDELVKSKDMTQSIEKNKKPLVRPTRKEAEEAVRVLLSWAGDDPNREGLIDTPERVINAYGELFGGYNHTPERHLETVFEDAGGYDEMVLVRDIPFYSFCEHHIIPFLGKVHVAYYPRDGVVGLSKFARIVDAYARRLQTQENLTCQIAETIQESLDPLGVAVMIEAEHMCMSIRGIKKKGSSTVTTQFTGTFENTAEEQNRFLLMVKS